MILGSKARVSCLIHTCRKCTCYMLPEIHLWCDTCWTLGSQHGSWAILFYIPVSRDLSSLHCVRPGRHSTNWAMPARLNFILSNKCLYFPTLTQVLFIPPANEVCDGYVFTPVCHSVHRRRGCLPQCMLRYTHPGQTTPGSSACWEIRSTSGRYASYWNAYLFNNRYLFSIKTKLLKLPFMEGLS